jgi:crotonobetaine/carnitine-CoA ligase
MSADLNPRQVLDLYPPHGDTIPSLLASRRTVAGHKPVLIFEHRTWTYAQLEEASSQLAGVLLRLGARRGDCVALVSLNSDVSLILFLATARMGALFVPLNPALTEAELGQLLGHCRPTLVAVQPPDVARLERVSRSLESAPRLLPLDEIGTGAAQVSEILARIHQQAARGPAAAVAPVAPDDPAVVIYTSGTTGFPKGVVHSHRNYVWAAEAFVERMHLQPWERLMTVLPFFHVNALFYSWGGALAAGAALVTTSRFSASQLWRLAAETGATQFNMLAAIGNILLKRPRGEFDPRHQIRKIYGGPIPAEVHRGFQEEFNVPTLIEGYGMTEIPGACQNPFGGLQKIGSIGKPAGHPRLDRPFVQMRVVDEAGMDVPRGEIGELLVKTPILMREYLRDPEQTRAATREGWFCTGDLVREDEDGYYYFVARKRDIIRRRGENISGAELDRILLEHPAILEAATIGVPSELGEEEVMAVLVPRAKPAPSPQEIIDWCQGRMAAMKIPRFVVFVDELPHTSSQRVAKYRLKQDRTLLAKAWSGVSNGSGAEEGRKP